jgi:hypothetical protein
VSPEQLTKARRREREVLARRAATAVGRMWRAVDPSSIAASWASALPVALAAVTAGQTAAAGSADEYLDELAGGGADTRVVTSRLAGVASDGRDLASLLFQPAVTALQTIRQGGTAARGLAAGGFATDMIVRTQVADAGRVADQVALIAHHSLAGYVRAVSAGACSRCIVLAGRFYSWKAGFDRHPRCHCVHVPATSPQASERLRTQPRAYFDSLSAVEQDTAFTRAGAESIRLGADIGQVVNARRGALGLTPAGARLTTAEARALRGGRDAGRLQASTVFGRDLYVTTEGTTTRGVAGVRLGAKTDGVKRAGGRYRSARPPRLMPESILQIAGDDRDEAIRLLERNGYLRAQPRAAQPAALAGESGSTD